MKEFKIHSKKYGLIITLVDNDDYKRMLKYTWHASYNKKLKSFHIGKNKSKTCNCLDCQQTYLSRFILNVPLGLKEIDHKNLNRLDNRKKNLRVSTRSENQSNRTVLSNNKSGYKGVSFNKQLKKYVVFIQKNKTSHYLGTFKSVQKGAIAYNRAAKKLHGEFARLNPIS